MKLSAIRHANGKCYLIDTCYITLGIFGGYYETMVFKVDDDIKDDTVVSEDRDSVLDKQAVSVDWGDLFCERYSTEEEATKGFSRIVNNFQQFFDENIDDKEGVVSNA